MSVEHDKTPSRATAGIDWASTEHAVSLVGPDGVEIQRVSIEHTAAACAH